jgi:hypothetical protein
MYVHIYMKPYDAHMPLGHHGTKTPILLQGKMFVFSILKRLSN